jgi:PIN domain nuclease of toxin-antitoxin system
VKVLLDTHVWLWWVTEPERIPHSALSIIEDGRNEILLSVASSWEIAIKSAIGKLQLPEPPEDFVPRRLMRDGIGTLHIEHRHALHVARLPPHHHDPFDRILIAQTQLEGIPIVTADPRFAPYQINVLWE